MQIYEQTHWYIHTHTHTHIHTYMNIYIWLTNKHLDVRMDMLPSDVWCMILYKNMITFNPLFFFALDLIILILLSYFSPSHHFTQFLCTALLGRIDSPYLSCSERSYRCRQNTSELGSRYRWFRRCEASSALICPAVSFLFCSAVSFTLHYPTLPYPALPYPTLCSFVLSCLALPCTAVPCIVSSASIWLVYCTVLAVNYWDEKKNFVILVTSFKGTCRTGRGK